jgi:hypothetical protein
MSSVEEFEAAVRRVPTEVPFGTGSILLTLQTWRRDPPLGVDRRSPIVFPFCFTVRVTGHVDMDLVRAVLEEHFRQYLSLPMVPQFPNRGGPNEGTTIVQLLAWA